MIRCQSCGSENLDASSYCDECGSRLAAPGNSANDQYGPVEFGVRPSVSGSSFPRPAQVTSVGIPPLVEKSAAADGSANGQLQKQNKGLHSTLVIERGESVGTEFQLSAEESYIGRWDADN